MTPLPPLSTLFPYTTLFRSTGVIADRPLFPGDMASTGQPLFVVMDISRIVARANVPQKEAAAIKLGDRKSTRLNSSHRCISYAVFCLKKKRKIKSDKRTSGD